MSFDDNKIARCLEREMDKMTTDLRLRGVGEEERPGSVSQLAATSLALQHHGNSCTRPTRNGNTSLFHPIT